MQASRFEAGADFRVVAMASKFRACVTTALDATAPKPVGASSSSMVRSSSYCKTEASNNSPNRSSANHFLATSSVTRRISR